MKIVLVMVVCIALAANCAISWGIIRCNAYSSRQKFVQIVVVWLLPILGALLARHFLNENRALPTNSEHPAPIGFDDGYIRPHSGADHIASDGSGGDSL